MSFLDFTKLKKDYEKLSLNQIEEKILKYKEIFEGKKNTKKVLNDVLIRLEILEILKKEKEFENLKEENENLKAGINHKEGIIDNQLKTLEKERNEFEEDSILLREKNENLEKLVENISYEDLTQNFKKKEDTNNFISIGFLIALCLYIILLLFLITYNETFISILIDPFNYLLVKILILGVFSILYYEYSYFKKLYQKYSYRRVLIQSVNIVSTDQNGKYGNLKNQFSEKLPEVLFKDINEPINPEKHFENPIINLKDKK